MISKDKQYCTRGGMSVRIYATDAGGLFPVHGAILNDGIWNGMKWTVDGHTHFTQNNCHISMDDLAEVKPRHKRTVWLNVYPDFEMRVWHSEKEANLMADGVYKRIACIKVDLDFEEGQGL